MTLKATPWDSNRNKELILNSQVDYILNPIGKDRGRGEGM